MGGDRIRLVASPRDGAARTSLLTELDGRFWTAEVTASFTGRVVGLFATEGTVTFTRFHAEGSDAQLMSRTAETPPWHEVQIELTAEASYAAALHRRGGLGRLHLRRRRAAAAGLLGRREPVEPALRGAVRRRLGLGVGGDGRRPRARRPRGHGHLPRRPAQTTGTRLRARLLADVTVGTPAGPCRRHAGADGRRHGVGAAVSGHPRAGRDLRTGPAGQGLQRRAADDGAAGHAGGRAARPHPGRGVRRRLRGPARRPACAS